MNHLLLVILSFWLVLVAVIPSQGQQNRPFDLLNDDIQDFLPPLVSLIDTALARDPLTDFREKQIIVNNHKLIADRRQWMRDIGFQADIRYGTFNNFSTNTAEGQTPSNFATIRSETVYGVGAYIKVPLFDITNRKNQIGLATTELAQAEDMFMMQQAEVRQKVIRQYNDVILKHRLLIVKSRYNETSRINMLMAEKEFLNGVIPVVEFSRVSQIVTLAEESYEQARIELQTSYMILEELVRMKLNILSDIP